MAYIRRYLLFNSFHMVKTLYMLLVVVSVVPVYEAQQPDENTTTVINMTQFNVSCDNATDFDCKNNGICLMSNNQRLCHCSSQYFTGPNCGIINLQLPVHDVFQTGIAFNWTKTIYFEDYYGLFTRTQLTQGSVIHTTPVYVISINGSNWKSSIVIDGMQPDQKEYLLCVIHKDELEKYMIYVDVNTTVLNTSVVIASGLMNSQYLNCGVLVTSFDRFGPYTLAAWAIGIALPCFVLLAMLVRALANCRDSRKRERLIAQVMGNFDFLRRTSTRKHDHKGGDKAND